MNAVPAYRNHILLFTLLLLSATAFPQTINKVNHPIIYSAKLFKYGNPQGLAVYTLNSNEQVELGFDDMDANAKSYYYTYVLCDYNWKPVNLNPFDYIKGFTQNRISTYRYSSRAFTRYTHYQAI